MGAGRVVFSRRVLSRRTFPRARTHAPKVTEEFDKMRGGRSNAFAVEFALPAGLTLWFWLHLRLGRWPAFVAFFQECVLKCAGYCDRF
jgi:hypothetical protein